MSNALAALETKEGETVMLPPPNGVTVAAIPTAPLPRQMGQEEADVLAMRLRITEAKYTLRMAELETMRLRPVPETVRPRRRSKRTNND